LPDGVQVPQGRGTAQGWPADGPVRAGATGCDAIDWSFATFEIERIVHCIDCENAASRAVARRLGARKDRNIDLFGHAGELWVTQRETWMASRLAGTN
jgi:hypothetical protein